MNNKLLTREQSAAQRFAYQPWFRHYDKDKHGQRRVTIVLAPDAPAKDVLDALTFDNQTFLRVLAFWDGVPLEETFPKEPSA